MTNRSTILRIFRLRWTNRCPTFATRSDIFFNNFFKKNPCNEMFFFSVWYIYLVANSISLARNIRSKKLRQERNEPESQSSSMLEYESSIHTRKKKMRVLRFIWLAWRLREEKSFLQTNGWSDFKSIHSKPLVNHQLPSTGNFHELDYFLK